MNSGIGADELSVDVGTLFNDMVDMAVKMETLSPTSGTHNCPPNVPPDPPPPPIPTASHVPATSTSVPKVPPTPNPPTPNPPISDLDPPLPAPTGPEPFPFPTPLGTHSPNTRTSDTDCLTSHKFHNSFNTRISKHTRFITILRNNMC